MSIKAGAGHGALQESGISPGAPGCPQPLLLPWAPLSIVAELCVSRPRWGWLKCWVPGRGLVLVESHRAWPHRPEGLSGEDAGDEQLACQEHAEQDAGAGALQEAGGRGLPRPRHGAQHGREVPARTARSGSARAARQGGTHPPSGDTSVCAGGVRLSTGSSGGGGTLQGAVRAGGAGPLVASHPHAEMA